MADERVIIKADLDAKKLIDEALHAKAALGEMASAESFIGLIETLKHVSLAIGVVGSAAFALKSALDLTLEAESIRRINSEFEGLAANAGLSAESIKRGLVQVADGLADDTDLIKAANEALIGMGASAKALPEVLTIARKATQVFGGDLVKNFEALNHALATGQTRMLRHFGIVVDNEGALAKYAKSIGVTVAQLTDAERRQAIMNAALEQANGRFAGVALSTNTATGSFQRLKVALNELKEAAALTFESVGGARVRSILGGFSDTIGKVGRLLKERFGDETEATEAKIKRLESTIESTHKRIEGIAAAETGFFGYSQAQKEKLIARNTELLKRLEAELAASRAEQEKNVEASEKEKQAALGSEEAKRNARKLTTEERAKNLLEEARALQLLDAATATRIKSEMEVEGDAQAMRALYAQQEAVLLEQKRAKLIEIEAQTQLGQITEATAASLRVELERQTAAEITNIKSQAYEAEARAAENLARRQREGLQGFIAGVKAASTGASKDWDNMASLGKKSFAALESAASNSLMALGSGSKDAASAIGGFFLGALADIAEAQGKVMLPLALVGNFAAAAAGAGLLVLAGFLRAKASAMGAAPSGGMGAETGGGGGGGGVMSAASEGASRPQPAEVLKQREVNINIAGNYLETPESRRYLLEMIRQESDATGFTYNQISLGAG